MWCIVWFILGVGNGVYWFVEFWVVEIEFFDLKVYGVVVGLGVEIDE